MQNLSHAIILKIRIYMQQNFFPVYSYSNKLSTFLNSIELHTLKKKSKYKQIRTLVISNPTNNIVYILPTCETQLSSIDFSLKQF